MRRWLWAVTAAGAAGAAGCAGGGAGADVRAAGGPGPVGEEPATVATEFLRAAGERDHAAMARRFGTGAGPVIERGGALRCGFRRVGSWVGVGEPCARWAEIELRMDVIARLLAHESRQAVAQERLAGRGRAAVRVEVLLQSDSEAFRVPLTVVRTDDGRWLVEEVGLDDIVVLDR